MAELTSLLEEATRIAESASKTALSYFRQALLIEMKENHTPVTIADKKTEEMIRRELERLFPAHGILGEEFGPQGEKAEFIWTVDPIDGTRSFIRGIPLFGTLIGLLNRGEPIVGVMVLPALGETYVAAKGMGTFCNGTQLRVSATTSIEAAILSVGDVTCFEAAGKTSMLHTAMNKAELCRGYTDCFGHSLVMRGAVDAMIDPIVNVWDVAPLACLIREAGGDYCSLDGVRTCEGNSFMSFAPGLKSDLMGLG
jgi:histidinol-phosphatase